MVEERKEKKLDIGEVEGCGKVAGKGGSPEASGDGGGRLGEGLVIGVVLAGRDECEWLAFVC